MTWHTYKEYFTPCCKHVILVMWYTPCLQHPKDVICQFTKHFKISSSPSFTTTNIQIQVTEERLRVLGYLLPASMASKTFISLTNAVSIEFTLYLTQNSKIDLLVFTATKSLLTLIEIEAVQLNWHQNTKWSCLLLFLLF